MFLAHSAGAVESADCISAKDEERPLEFPLFDYKPSDAVGLVFELWGKWTTSSLPLFTGPFRFFEF